MLAVNNGSPHVGPTPDMSARYDGPSVLAHVPPPISFHNSDVEYRYLGILIDFITVQTLLDFAPLYVDLESVKRQCTVILRSSQVSSQLGVYIKHLRICNAASCAFMTILRLINNVSPIQVARCISGRKIGRRTEL